MPRKVYSCFDVDEKNSKPVTLQNRYSNRKTIWLTKLPRQCNSHVHSALGCQLKQFTCKKKITAESAINVCLMDPSTSITLVLMEKASFSLCALWHQYSSIYTYISTSYLVHLCLKLFHTDLHPGFCKLKRCLGNY